jgi:gas vesicle protein
MRNETTPIERVRAVLVALAMVLSVVGGAAAVAGPSLADGSLQDDGTAGEVSSDDGVGGGTDDVGDSAETTVDDGDSGPTVEDTTETIDDTTESVEDTAEDTAETVEDTTETVEDTTETVEDTAEDTTETVEDTVEDTTGVVDSDDGETDGSDGATTLASTQESQTDSGESASAGADPASVGVTAGATNQAPIETAGEGPATLRLTEDEAGAFPDNGTARLTLPDDAGVTFDVANSSATVTGDGASATVSDVSATAVTVQVEGTDPDATSSLNLEGVRFTVAPDASATDATWSFGNVSAATAVEPERLIFDGFGDDVPRGAAKVPEDETGLIIRVPSDARSSGFHEERDDIGVIIPDEYADDIAFDTSADLQVTSEGGDCGLPVVGDPRPEDYYLGEDYLVIEPSCTIEGDAYVSVQGLRFNVSGANASEPAEFVADIDGAYDPVDSIDKVWVAAGSPVEAHAPVVAAGETTVSAGATNTTGDGAVRISISDDVGRLMGENTRMTVELEDSGVTFNESQELEVASVSGDSPPPSLVSANGTTVVLEVDGETSAGDEFRIQRAGGEALRFDVTEGANDTALRVTTTPGAEDVTQVTDTVVAVGPAECLSVRQAIAGDDDRISNPELAQAIDYWREGTEVPDTCGETISNPQIAEIKDLWRTGGTVE